MKEQLVNLGNEQILVVVNFERKAMNRIVVPTAPILGFVIFPILYWCCPHRGSETSDFFMTVQNKQYLAKPRLTKAQKLTELSAI
ncbi:MAG: hypothetical protein QNJ55_15100 [Xenococcus sp. MO_188.B8]|nr:hypothetical protein [Xenococcus sp. MO_188.B8]